MPPVKETAQQKADRAVAAVKDRPEVVASVKTHLIARGWWDAPAAASPLKKHVTEPSSLEIRPSAPDESTDFGKACKTMRVLYTAGIDTQVELHRNYKTWGQIPPKFLRQMLHLCEPISLHSRLLLGLCVKGQREVPKAPLLEILERMAAIDSNSLIGEQTLLWQLSVFLNERNVLQGRPCKDLQLPADWSKDGVWELVKLASGCAVSRKGSNIPPVAHPDVADVDFADLYLEANHSEAKATVRSRTNALLCKSCIVLCAFSECARGLVPQGGSEMETPPKKRQTQRLALQDDEESDALDHDHGRFRKITSREIVVDKKASNASDGMVAPVAADDGVRGDEPAAGRRSCPKVADQFEAEEDKTEGFVPQHLDDLGEGASTKLPVPVAASGDDETTFAPMPPADVV